MSFYNIKARQFVIGRKNIFTQLQQSLAHNTHKIIWFHCASLGEFEQARPIIEQLKATAPQYKILLTFFSPSGYEIQKNYHQADYVFYLPKDTQQNAQHFLAIVKPSLIIYIKYEFWYHYITQAQQLHIPLILTSAIFRSNQPFFKWYGNLHQQMLKCFTQIFVQDNSSAQLLQKIGMEKNVVVCGDTRFDRVVEIANQEINIPAIEQFIGNSTTIVAGSTWTEDDEELDHFANTNTHIKFIIAPHEIDNDRLQECLHLYKNACLYSNINNASDTCNVVIIDNIGMLSKLYSYATISYVGGGFAGDGVHNVLEAAVYGKPVIFGPIYDKFIEAQELENAQGACVVENALELEKTINQLLNNKTLYAHYCINAKNYVAQKIGATQQIINYVYENLLRIN